MASNYDSVDFDFSYDGDLVVDAKGDIQDTSSNLLLSIQNEISTILRGNVGDWQFAPQIGADLYEFVGEPNNRATATELKARVESALTQIVAARDLDVRILPVHAHKVLIMLSLEVLPTPANGLKSGERLATTFLYDYQENGLYADPDQLNLLSGRSF